MIVAAYVIIGILGAGCAAYLVGINCDDVDGVEAFGLAPLIVVGAIAWPLALACGLFWALVRAGSKRRSSR